MSGFVSLVSLDGAPHDPVLLESCLAALRERGPDAAERRIAGRAALGHTLLRSTRESADERQPWTSDGRVWLVSDARLDARTDLIAALDDIGLTTRPDAELTGLAYQRWGDACVERLLGDFSFAVWDDARQRLLCARDHLGVKPLYYAVTSTHLVVSNTLDCVRRHPGVSSDLNELAIADFLVTGDNQDASTTIYRDIQRVPPAHLLTWDRDQGVRLRPYWTMPIDAPVRFRRSADYVERFRELLGLAVADRLRTDRASVFMSGGLDSTSVALSARHNARDDVRGCDLQAITGVYDTLIPDEERRFAELAAAALGIRIRVLPADAHEPYAHWDDPAYRSPEPSAQVFVTADREGQREAARHARVALTGYGADPLFVHLTDVAACLRRRDLRPILSDILRSLAAGRRPPIGVRTVLRTWRTGAPPGAHYAVPNWLDREFVRRLRLQERYDPLVRSVAGEPHPTRELSRRNVLAPLWARVFEAHDPAATGCRLEFRHPFFDLRVIRFVWAIPAVPWTQSKRLLRHAMRGFLPNEIRLRRKTPLGGDPLAAWCQNADVRDRLRRLVDEPRSTCCPTAFPPALDDEATRWTNLRPVGLEHWLRTSGLRMNRPVTT